MTHPYHERCAWTINDERSEWNIFYVRIYAILWIFKVNGTAVYWLKISAAQCEVYQENHEISWVKMKFHAKSKSLNYEFVRLKKYHNDHGRKGWFISSDRIWRQTYIRDQEMNSIDDGPFAFP